MKKLFFLFIMVSQASVFWGQGIWAVAGKSVSEATLKRQLYAAARQELTPSELQNILPYSLAQIHRPRHEEVLGTAWLAKYKDRYWIVMPYHIGGSKGSERDIYLYTLSQTRKKLSVKVKTNGSAGFHSPDVSIAEVSAEDVRENIPLEIGEPDLTQPAYSFGYTMGRFSLQDWFPVRRMFLEKEGFGLTSTRNLFGETDVDHPFNLSGYCGSPLFQQQAGVWKVVGMHTGSAVCPGMPLSNNRSFAVSMPEALAILWETLTHPSPVMRPLNFHGSLVTELAPSERVRNVEVVRNNMIIFSQELRNFSFPYSDEHAERAFSRGPVLQSEDILRFYIQDNTHHLRVEEFYIW